MRNFKRACVAWFCDSDVDRVSPSQEILLRVWNAEAIFSTDSSELKMAEAFTTRVLESKGGKNTQNYCPYWTQLYVDYSALIQ